MNFEYTVKRKHIKNIYIRISSSDGMVHITAPYLCSNRRIDEFVHSKEKWIESKRIEIISKPKRDFNIDDRNKLINKIQYYLPIWEKKTGLYSSSWTIRNMKTRWGSCNTKTGKINFNLQLILFDDDCLEYVILHELCHLKIPNHSKDFYNLIETYMPDYKNIRKKLKY